MQTSNTPSLSLFSKNNFQFLLFLWAADPLHDARRRRRGSAKQWSRSKGKRLYLAARVSIYPVLSFISIPWKLFRGPFSIGEPIPASFSQAVPQPSRSSRSAYLRAFPSIKQPRAWFWYILHSRHYLTREYDLRSHTTTWDLWWCRSSGAIVLPFSSVSKNVYIFCFYRTSRYTRIQLISRIGILHWILFQRSLDITIGCVHDTTNYVQDCQSFLNTSNIRIPLSMEFNTENSIRLEWKFTRQ